MGLPLSWGVYKNRNEMEGLEAYENKGKGNPYHDKLGRFTTGPGGGAGKGGEKGSSKYKVGDTYRKGGEVFEAQEGENGPMGVSKDGKIVTELPDKLRYDQTKMIEEMFDGLRDEGIPMGSPRYQAAKDAYDRIQKKASGVVKKGLEASEAPKMVKEEVERFLKQVEATGSSKSVESYYKSAKGVLDGWSKGNGGVSKPQSSEVKEEVAELKAELDSLYDRYRAMSTPKGFRERK